MTTVSKANRNVYPTNGFVIMDREGYRAFQYEETVKLLKKRNDKRIQDPKFLKQLKLKIFGVNWKW